MFKMNQNLLKALFLYSVINLISIGFCFGRTVGKFCDNNFVDAVLWNGITYRLTRNEWIATYDTQTRTVGQLVHLNDDSFQNVKGYYYQSVYYIPTVPECNQTTVSCQMINRLQGIVVYAIRRYFSSDKQNSDVINRFYRNENMNSDINNIQDHNNIQSFIERNLLPKRSNHKYRPSVYSPKDFTFIHITNQYQNFGPLLETIQLQTNGKIERTYHQLNQFKDIVFITSFWWTLDQKVYIIGEHKSGIGNPFIYEFELKNNNKINFKPINKSVLEFFGCHKPRDNKLDAIIKNKISSYDLGQWSVQTVDPMPNQTQNKAMNKANDQRVKHFEMKPTVQPITHPYPQPTQQLTIIKNKISHQSNQQKAHPIKVQRSDQKMVYSRNQTTTERQYDSTINPLKTKSTTNLKFEERSRYSSTLKPRTDPTHIQQIGQRTDYGVVQTKEIGVKLTLNRTTHAMETSILSAPKLEEPIKVDRRINLKSQRKKYVSLKPSNFWKIFPIIIMSTLLILSIFVIIIGILAFFNVQNLLNGNNGRNGRPTKTFNGLKNERLKYDYDFNDFSIEEYNTTPKRIPSVENNSCQTNMSFESTDEVKPARTIL